MTDTNLVQDIDLDNLTDDEVNNLNLDQIEAFANKEDKLNEEENTEETNSETTDGISTETIPLSTEEKIQEEQTLNSENKNQSNEANETLIVEEPQIVEPSQEGIQLQESKVTTETSTNIPENEINKSKIKNQESKSSAESVSTSEPKLSNENQIAVDFFNKVSAPFKADGKDMTIRTPEDAIRLMQQGVNYSRRMQEMKPMRAMDQMLKKHGLNDPEQLSFLIDIKNGDKDAIRQLLKNSSIDPFDFDMDEKNTSPYSTPDYSEDPKDLDFQEAISTTQASPGGSELITDIDKDWDDISKEALRDQPGIFSNLLEQKSSGVYEKIIEELKYQKTMGYLSSVPFLQAYHQVGDAMEKAGVFNSQTEEINNEPNPKEIVPITTPIDTGPRKVTQPKNVIPNQNLSSTPIRSAPSADNNSTDYASMSDADFLKLGEPN